MAFCLPTTAYAVNKEAEVQKPTKKLKIYVFGKHYLIWIQFSTTAFIVIEKTDDCLWDLASITCV